MLRSGIPTEKSPMPLFLASGLFCLLLGTYAGLLRLGLALPGPWAGYHGPLMVCGFLGTLIGLERAARVGSPWALLVPLSAFGGALLLLAGLAEWAVRLWLFSAVFHIGVFLKGHFPLKWPEDIVSFSGLFCWGLGLLLWLQGKAMREVSFVLLYFPVLTILAERWPGSRSGFKTGGFVALGMGVGLSALLPEPQLAMGLSGLCLSASGLFLLIEERLGKAQTKVPSDRAQGWDVYLERVMFLSYGWLSLSGLWLLIQGTQGLSDPHYDLLIHGLSLGFILGVIYAHFYKVLKALLGTDLHFNPWFYLPWGLLQTGLLLRFVGKLSENAPLWQMGGSLNGLSVLVFLGLIIGTLKGRSI